MGVSQIAGALHNPWVEPSGWRLDLDGGQPTSLSHHARAQAGHLAAVAIKETLARFKICKIMRTRDRLQRSEAG